MIRVISYVDGFNLYFGLRSKKWRKYYWLNLVALSSALLKPDQKLEHCHYFTARISESGGKSQDSSRQSTWLDALASLENLTIHYGHFLGKNRHCRKCGATWVDHEEKMTDVNIASQILTDAYDDRFDMALVISGDSDLTAPIRIVRERFPAKRVIVAFPPKRHSDQLRKTANAAFVIGEGKFRKSLMPQSIKTKSGHILRRPQEWT